MTQFQYTARGLAGDLIAGVLSAANADEAARQLRERKLFPVKVEAAKARRTAGFGQRVKPRVLAKFYSQMSDLLKSGVPLLRTLELLQQQATAPRLAEVVGDIRGKVADGTALADAMGDHEAVFGELAVSMVRAGEQGGFLEDVFKRTAVFTERQEDLRGKVVGAMAYPAILCIIGGLVLTILIVFFVPKFADIFARLRERGEMPAITEWLLWTSQTLRSYGLLLLAAAVGGWFLLRKYLATPEGRETADRVKLKIPMAGRIFQDLAITRFNRVLGTLRANGIPILGALKIAKDSTGNVLMKRAIDQAAENVQAGDKLATPLRASGVFPADIVEMIAVAEESNNLEVVLLESADSLEAATTRQLDIAVRLLEPLLLLVMATLVLFVVIALLLPIFKMTSAIG